jgi:hypothetical protein
MTEPRSGEGPVTVPSHRRDDSRSESECRGWGSNPHAPFGAQDFKSCASASFATPASVISFGFYAGLKFAADPKSCPKGSCEIKQERRST